MTVDRRVMTFLFQEVTVGVLAPGLSTGTLLLLVFPLGSSQ